MKWCIYAWLYCTCLQIYSYLVVHSDISTTRLELFYILHRRLGFYTVFKSPVSVFLQLRVFFKSTPEYQTELVRLNWVVIKFIFFFPQVNKLHCFFKSLKKTWRYSWEKQEVQLVSSCFYQLTCISSFSFFHWWWNQYTTSTFRTTSGRYVPLKSCFSFLSSKKNKEKKRKENQLGNPLTCIIKRLYGVQAETVQQRWLQFTKFH